MTRFLPLFRHSTLQQPGRSAVSMRAALVGLALYFGLTLVPIASAAGASGNRFFAGYCTWEAAELGYQAWGVWVPWLGDDCDWSAGAQAAGWTVSTTPQP